MPLIMFLLFVILPILEIAVIIRVGGAIGVLPTIAIMIGMAIAGTWLIRSQSRIALTRAAEQLRGGKPPVDEVIDGFGILVAGLLLLTPGFITDVLGLALLVPPVRRRIARGLFSAFAKRADIRVTTSRFDFRRGRRPEDVERTRPGSPGGRPPSQPTTIEGEYSRVDDEDAPGRDDEQSDANGGSSPWRR